MRRGAMPNTDSGFKVDPDALDSVADMIQNLLDDLSGAHGRVAGSVPEFAKCADIGTALATFWGTRDNVFADAYGYEHKGITDTYTAIQTQLTNLQNAARSTAASYRAQEQATKDAMKT